MIVYGMLEPHAEERARKKAQGFVVSQLTKVYLLHYLDLILIGMRDSNGQDVKVKPSDGLLIISLLRTFDISSLDVWYSPNLAGLLESRKVGRVNLAVFVRHRGDIYSGGNIKVY